MRLGRIGRALTLAAAVTMTLAGSARAAYEPAQLISDDSGASLEFLSATEPAISGDGQWVAFEGTNDDLSGVWERNLQTGALASVDTIADLGNGPDPTGPSISANGQFVAFTSPVDPDPVNTPDPNGNCPEVYVRNMAIPAGQPGAFTLVAEQDGGSTPIQFPACGNPATLAIAGAQAAPGVAMSADGSEVAFTIVSNSNLGFPGEAPSVCGAADTTCGSQVVVRNLNTQTTTVVSVTPSGTPTPNGGAYPSATSSGTGGWGAESDEAEGMSQYGDPPASTASISADGSTVAWMGTNLQAQIPGGAPDVTAGMQGNRFVEDQSDPQGQEVEPLWRRLSGSGADQTTRLLAGAGLSFFGYERYYDTNATSAAPAILGGSAEQDPDAPALNANGSEVLVTSDAPNAARLAALAQYPAFTGNLKSDLYLVDMGNPATPQVTPITQITSDVSSDGTDASSDEVSGTVADAAISPSGNEIAFETDRTQFSLPYPALISPPVTYTQKAETYVIDLATGTLQLATSTYDGLAPDGGSGDESVDDAGDVAIESAASNLFYGDVPGDLPEVLLLPSTPPSTAVATETLSALPHDLTDAAPPARWSISVTASARRSGSVRLHVSVPGAGELRAVAAAQLPRGGSAVASRRIPFRPVGSARASARRRSLVQFTMILDRADRRYATGHHGLYARIAVRFSATGHHALRVTVPVTFRIAASHPGHRR